MVPTLQNSWSLEIQLLETPWKNPTDWKPSSARFDKESRAHVGIGPETNQLEI